MDIHEELNRDFYIQQFDDKGYVYYVPQKKMVKVKPDIAEKLMECQKNREKISIEVENILSAIKRQMLDAQEEISGEKDRKYIKKLELVVSTICNLNCIYCYANGGTYDCEEEIMPFSIVDSLVEHLKQNDIEIGMVQFFGGEPLMAYKTISYICRQFEKKHIAVKRYSMVSNFTFLPDEFLEDIIKYNIKITVSVDGPPEITNKQRVGKVRDIDVYNTVRENIDKLREKGGDINAIECTCTDMYVELGYTKDSLRNFIQEEFQVKHVIIEDASYKYGESSREEEIMHFQRGEYTIEEGLVLGYLFDKKKNSVFCSAGEKVIAIFPDGNIYPCHQFAMKKQEYLMGNVSNGKWEQTEQYKGVIEKICNAKSAHKCEACSARNFCSQCLALTMVYGEPVQCNKRKKEFSIAMSNYLKNRCIIHI